MKVGLFLKNYRPEIGGGATFESEVLQSLIQYGGDCRHNFIILSWRKEIEQVLSGTKIQFLPLQQSYIQNNFPQRWQRKLVITANNLCQKINLNIKFPEKNLVEKLIIDSGIEIIWYLELGTYNYPTVELPYITTVWDLEHRNHPYFPEVSAAGKWEKREKSYSHKIQRAAVIITGTQAGKAEIERFYQVVPKNIKVLPYPTPSFALNAENNHSKNVLSKFNISQKYLFYPAQFWPHKNHAGLLLALKLLREQYGIIFPVVFTGADKGNLEYIKQLVVELNLNNQVHFLGFVSQSDLIALYRYAFALTFVTFFGPDNLPPLEAFALGCPVIASNVAGAQEQLKDAALLVDPRDEKQIALAIKSLHDSPKLRSSLVEKGLKQARQWTGKDYIQRILAILDELESIRRCWNREKLFYQK
jgi:glycosyltransferase involved in cell wall biosynthesis